MTQEEKDRMMYLEGKVDALMHLCAYLVATNPISDNLAAMLRNRANRESCRDGVSADEQAYLKGYLSVLPDIDSARSVVHQAGLMTADIPDSRN